MKLKMYKFKKIKSTNDMAINLIKKKGKKSGYVHAETQTKGKGTHGKKWISKKGNLFMTIFFPLNNKYPPFNHFYLINPIILSDVIKNFCNKNNISLKFPNDIFVNKKKICGILQEIITSKSSKFLIIGIGININSSPKLKKTYLSTSIFKETKEKPNIKKVINLIVSSYEIFFSNLKKYNYLEYKKKAQEMAL